MKICVSSSSGSLDAAVDSRFGRCPYFVIVDSETMEFKTIPNDSSSAAHGAGPIAVKMLVEAGIQVVLANELGIGASDLLKQHNITFIPTKPDTNVQVAAKKAMLTQT